MSIEWFYRIGEQEYGPVQSKSLKLLAEVGQIKPNTLVRKTTSKSWTEAYHVKQLFDAHDVSQRTIDAPPIIAQTSSSEQEQKELVQPPPQVLAVDTPPPIIPTAELAVPKPDVMTSQINIVTTSKLNGVAEKQNPSPNDTDADTVEHIRSKRPLTLVLTLIGLIILTIPTAWYLYSEPSTTNVNTSTQMNYPAVPNAERSTTDNSRSPANNPHNHSLQINNVFSKQSPWIDPTNDQFQLTHNARLSITHAWLDTQQTEQPIFNIVVKIENRDKSTALSLQRQFAIQNTADRPNALNPYVPLIRLATGDGHLLDSKIQLVNRTIPAASDISETYQITLTVEQVAKLEQVRVAVPKAWFNKSGYWGFEIPQVMITSTKPTLTPVQIASEPNSTSGNLVKSQPSNVTNETVASTKPPTEGKGVLPPSPFGNNTTETKPKNGDQPATIQDLQSQIDVKKTRVTEHRDGEQPK